MKKSVQHSSRLEPTCIPIVLDASGSVYRDVVAGVSTYARRQLEWLIHVEEYPWNVVPHLMSTGARGVIACVRSADLEGVLRMLPIPVVYIRADGVEVVNSEPSREPCAVSGDDQAIGRMGCDFLVDQQSPRLAFVGIASAFNITSLNTRAAAFKDRAVQRHVPCSVRIVECPLAKDWSRALDSVDDWLQSLEKPVGLMAYNDAQAAQILQLCTIRNLVVPEQLAVLGVGNDPVLCELSRPSLSSVDYSLRMLAYKAASLLDGLLAGDASLKKLHRMPPLGVTPRFSTNRQKVDDEDVMLAREFITTHFSESIQVGDVADAVQVSRATLKRKFRAIIGRSVSEEIQRVRIEHAKHLLASTDIKLSLVARQIGLRSQEHLNGLFRKVLGITPQSFRDQMPGVSSRSQVPIDTQPTFPEGHGTESRPPANGGTF